MLLNLISAILLSIVGVCLAYLWVIALASIKKPRFPIHGSQHKNRFAIVIPAHDEEAVIGNTVANLMHLDYPKDLFTIYVVADFCSDRTAQNARDQGAICYERVKGERGGKGAALSWLFDRIFTSESDCDAIVVFDADTRVHPNFLQVMNDRFNHGALVIQGKHIISNPQDGWFPALTWCMMTIDNRFNNLGRSNLNLSAKHMGDSICFSSKLLRQFGWGSGLTEDYDFRLRLLHEGFRIHYEPHAIGYGQAPVSWHQAQSQRLRWARGIKDAGKQYRNRLLQKAIRHRDWSRLDGVVGTVLPSYSTLSLSSIFVLPLHLVFIDFFEPELVFSWAVVTLLSFAYPLFGLILEKAPAWAYLVIFSGPLFMLWRTWVSLRVRFIDRNITWVRTSHQEKLPVNSADLQDLPGQARQNDSQSDN